MNTDGQIKAGAILSYFTIAFNMIAGLIYTPWMITKIGQADYGLYTLATSLITLFVIDFGMSAAVARFVAKYNAEGDQTSVNNFLGVVYKLYLAIAAIIFTAFIILSFFLEGIYDNLSSQEMDTFKVLYVIVGLFNVISFPFITLNGILTAYEQFVGLKIADLLHKIIIIVAMVIALLLGQGVFALVTVNAISGLITIIIKLIIIYKKTEARPNFKYKDQGMLKEIFGFSMWTTISSLAQRLIFNITPSIIVAVSTTGAVGSAIFGLATTIEGYVYTFASALNGMFMPKISRIVYQGKKDEELMALMIRVGRLQCMIIGTLVIGFIAFGKSFIMDIWHKGDFYESYICAVLLIIPSFFFLPLQIANTTIIVENKVKLQSFVFVIMGVLNVGCSLILSRYYGAIGASISIFIAYMVRTTLMVLIHIKGLHLKMGIFFKETFLKITPYLLICLFIGILLERYNPIANSTLCFVLNMIVFSIVTLTIMIGFVMNAKEKELILGMIKAIKTKKR